MSCLCSARFRPTTLCTLNRSTICLAIMGKHAITSAMAVPSAAANVMETHEVLCQNSSAFPAQRTTARAECGQCLVMSQNMGRRHQFVVRQHSKPRFAILRCALSTLARSVVGMTTFTTIRHGDDLDPRPSLMLVDRPVVDCLGKASASTEPTSRILPTPRSVTPAHASRETQHVRRDGGLVRWWKWHGRCKQTMRAAIRIGMLPTIDS
jgi:hypothetical protein